MRGLLRVHQFYKLEQYVICRDDEEESATWHQRLLANAEEHAAGAGNPLSGGRDLDRRHGRRQVPDERHRILGASASANIARPTAARPCTTGRRGARICGGATRSARSASSTRSTTPLWPRPRILVPLLENHQTADGRVQAAGAAAGADGGRLSLTRAGRGSACSCWRGRRWRRASGAASAARRARAGGRAEADGRSRLPRQRPDHAGPAARARRGRLSRRRLGPRPQHAASRRIRSTGSARGSRPSAGAGR